MPPGNRIIEDICNLPMTITEARGLYRSALAMANAVKAATTISSAITFVQAEAARSAFQSALDALNGSELSRLRGDTIAATVLTNAAQLCRLIEAVFLLGVGIEGDGAAAVATTMTAYGDQTQAIKKAHTAPPPTNTGIVPPAIPVVVAVAPPDTGLGAGKALAVGGAALGILGFVIWMHNRA
jgi:hypothetical protein